MSPITLLSTAPEHDIERGAPTACPDQHAELHAFLADGALVTAELGLEALDTFEALAIEPLWYTFWLQREDGSVVRSTRHGGSRPLAGGIEATYSWARYLIGRQITLHAAGPEIDDARLLVYLSTAPITR